MLVKDYIKNGILVSFDSIEQHRLAFHYIIECIDYADKTFGLFILTTISLGLSTVCFFLYRVFRDSPYENSGLLLWMQVLWFAFSFLVLGSLSFTGAAINSSVRNPIMLTEE